MDWTSEAIEALRGFWAEGHSTAEIGRRMGISKNAVVGKAHRLNLPPRPSPIRREASVAAEPRSAPVASAVVATPAAPAPAPKAAPVPQPAAAAAPPPAPRAAPPAPVAAQPAPRPPAPPARKPAPMPNAIVRPFLRSSSRSCCWPIGEPGTPEFRFCTAQAMSGKPYCPEHAAVAYVKVRDRREDAA
jgi:GcrA cell cycle regulator